jgi:hypothetical protein
MNIKEVKKQRYDLELQLASLIGAEIRKFREKTGFSIKNIYGNFVEVTSIENTESEFIIDAVKCDLAI